MGLARRARRRLALPCAAGGYELVFWRLAEALGVAGLGLLVVPARVGAGGMR
jgi:hypothetical protein